MWTYRLLKNTDAALIRFILFFFLFSFNLYKESGWFFFVLFIQNQFDHNARLFYHQREILLKRKGIKLKLRLAHGYYTLFFFIETVSGGFKVRVTVSKENHVMRVLFVNPRAIHIKGKWMPPCTKTIPLSFVHCGKTLYTYHHFLRYFNYINTQTHSIIIVYL